MRCTLDEEKHRNALRLQEPRQGGCESKLVVSYKSTAANVHYSQVLEDLIDDEDEAVFANSAYTSKSSDERLLKNDCQNFIQFKAQRGQPLTAEGDCNEQVAQPYVTIALRALFGRMSQMALDRLRSIGPAPANQHIGLSNLVYNIDRYAFLCK